MRRVVQCAAPMHAALIGLDWGTSTLRALAYDRQGRVLAQRESACGLMQLPAAPAGLSGDAAHAARFEQALQHSCGDWLAGPTPPPVLACGMVGSAQGWREQPYLPLPCAPQALAQALGSVPSTTAPVLRLVPGLRRGGARPDVMRGEETQVLGVLQALQPAPGQTLWIGLPGTHSKWVQVRDGVVLDVETFMTGELHAALCRHTLLGRTMAPEPQADEAAFDRGLALARSPAGRLGLLSTIFSTRTLGLAGELAPEVQAEYLSGLLIGHELAGLAHTLALPGPGSGAALPRLALAGAPALCRRYQRALHQCGWPAPQQVEDASARGLWMLACAAGLVEGASP